MFTCGFVLSNRCFPILVVASLASYELRVTGLQTPIERLATPGQFWLVGFPTDQNCLEPTMGFGPMTSSLPKRCATPALRGPTLPSGLAPPRPNTLASGSCPLGPNPEATTLVIIAGFLHPRNRPGGWMLEVARRRNWRWPERPDPPTSRLRPLTSKMVGGGGFEPPKASPTDLQSAPFDRSGIPPKRRLEVRRWRFERYSEGRPSNFQLLTSRTWSRRWDSNPQPEVYKTPALPIELRRRTIYGQFIIGSNQPPVNAPPA